MNRHRIIAELKSRGHSGASVARDLNLAPNTVYAVMGGARSRRVEAQIARLLGRPVEEIFPDRYPRKLAN